MANFEFVFIFDERKGAIGDGVTIDRGQWVSEAAGLIDQVMGNMCAGGSFHRISSTSPPAQMHTPSTFLSAPLSPPSCTPCTVCLQKCNLVHLSAALSLYQTSGLPGSH